MLGNVAEFDFDKKGGWLVTVIDATGQIGNGVHLRDLKTGAEYPIENGKAAYRSLAWNDETTAFTITKAVEDEGYEGKWISIIGFSDLGPKPTKSIYDPKGDKFSPRAWQWSARAAPPGPMRSMVSPSPLPSTRRKSSETAPAETRRQEGDEDRDQAG